jgi:glycosyltransferase involved in cell wall biosynthesis
MGGTTVGVFNFVAATAGTEAQSRLVTTIEDCHSPVGENLRAQARSAGCEISLFQRTGPRWGRSMRWGVSLDLVGWLLRHVREYDLVVLHGGWLLSSVAALCAGRLMGKPVVMLPHGSLSEFDVNRPGNVTRIAAKSMLKKIYGRYCSLFIFNSDVEAENSFPRGSKAQFAVVPLPLFDENSVSLPRRGRVDAVNFRLGFLGRLHPQKNADALIRSLAILPNAFTLLIGGDGEMRSGLERLADELHVSDRITWTGFVPADLKDNFFNSIDVLVMPSLFESFGIVAAEAMVRGVPVIVSPTTGAAELIDKFGGGIVVEPRPEAIAEAVVDLSRNPERMAKLSREAIETAIGQLSFSRIGPRLADHYRAAVRHAKHVVPAND